MKWLMRVFQVIIVAMMISACESPAVKPDDAQSVDPATQTQQPEAVDTTVLSADCPPPCAFPKNAINDPSSVLAQRLVYFDYDQSDIKSEYEELLKNHAQYLAANPDVKIRLEGHTDERGSREYNLALSEHRAKAVQKILMLHGAPADNISVVSFGEEMPQDAGHQESAWAQNRRVELIYAATHN